MTSPADHALALASCDLRGREGPFDIIGDVHGCADELLELLSRLGYRIAIEGAGESRRAEVEPPRGRTAIFVGDLVDRGPRVPDTLRIVMALVERAQALCVPGNHDAKFLRWLEGRNVKPTHGLDRSIAQMEADDPRLREEARTFLTGLPTYLWLAQGALAVAHAGIQAGMIGTHSGHVRQFCLYGDTDGERDANDLVIRYHWAAHYRSPTQVIYGHTPVPAPAWVNNTLCIDTGCCFGGSLTALRWPEREIVHVPARAEYAERRRPFGHPAVRPPA